MTHEDTSPFEPSTYFGLWSNAKYFEVASLLKSLSVRFYRVEAQYDEAHLREWFAWDPTSASPYTGQELFIHSDDLEKVGSKIVEKFPERKFDK